MAATQIVSTDNDVANISVADIEVIIVYGVEFNISVEYIPVNRISVISIDHM